MLDLRRIHYCAATELLTQPKEIRLDGQCHGVQMPILCSSEVMGCRVVKARQVFNMTSNQEVGLSC